MTERSATIHPSLVLGAWAEAFVSGRRVALLGDGSTGLCEHLAEVSGRRVHVYDPDPKRLAASIAAAPRDGQVSRASLDELDVRGGAFDVVVVPDAAITGDTAALVELAASLLSPRGVLLLVSSNPDASDDDNVVGYYELYDLVSAQLEHVYMLGQAPFEGYTVAAFAAEGEPAVTIDTSLVTSDAEPAWFIVVACQHELDVEPYTVVQVPLGGSLPPAAVDEHAIAEAAQERAALEAKLSATREREQRAAQLAEERKQRGDMLSAKVAELSAKIAELHAAQAREQAATQAAHAAAQATKAAKAAWDRERDTLRADAAGKQALVERLAKMERLLERERRDHARAIEDLEESHQLDLDHMLERIAELEGDEEQDDHEREPSRPPVFGSSPHGSSALAAHDQPAAEADEGALHGLRFQIEELKRTLATARDELYEQRQHAARAASLEDELAKLREERAAMPTSDVSDGPDSARPDHGEIDALEAQLKERGQLVSQLRAELREGERTGRELVTELQAALKHDAPAAASSGPIEAQHDVATLEEKCSRYEADLQAAGWKITALEERIREEDDASDDAKLEAALRAARDELNLLKSELGRR
jgi:SAM-dependent methyltransferase